MVNKASARFSFCLFAVSFCSTVHGLSCEQASADGTVLRADSVAIHSAPVFDESDPRSKWFHRTANSLHISTRDRVLEDRLPFKAGDQINTVDIKEAERIIRSLSYIRDARVVAECDAVGSAKVALTAWDKWSLLPNLSFRRAGGKSQSAVGILENNLLGLGISAQLRYTSGDLRDGYQLGWSMPITRLKHGSVAGAFGDFDDGHVYRLALEQPFYELNGRSMYSAIGQSEKREDEIYQNGLTAYEFEHEIDFLTLGLGWSRGLQSNEVWRWTAGLTIDRHRFDASEEGFSPEFPQDRRFVYPWVGVQYIENQFAVLTDIFVFSQREDINLGWTHSLNLGIEANDLDESGGPGAHVNASSMKAWRRDEDILLFEINGQAVLQTEQRDYYDVSASLQAFHRVRNNWTVYAKTAVTASENNFLDRPVTLGGENGVRGYPFQYQHGDKRWNASLESRFYPRIDVDQLFELAWVIFADAGRAWDSNRLKNETRSTVGSVGIGLRIFGPRFSGNSVVHMDLAHPLTSGTDVSDWEWRVEVRRQF